MGSNPFRSISCKCCRISEKTSEVYLLTGGHEEQENKNSNLENLIGKYHASHQEDFTIRQSGDKKTRKNSFESDQQLTKPKVRNNRYSMEEVDSDKEKNINEKVKKLIKAKSIERDSTANLRKQLTDPGGAKIIDSRESVNTNEKSTLTRTNHSQPPRSDQKLTEQGSYNVDSSPSSIKYEYNNNYASINSNQKRVKGKIQKQSQDQIIALGSNSNNNISSSSKALKYSYTMNYNNMPLEIINELNGDCNTLNTNSEARNKISQNFAKSGKSLLSPHFSQTNLNNPILTEDCEECDIINDENNMHVLVGNYNYSNSKSSKRTNMWQQECVPEALGGDSYKMRPHSHSPIGVTKSKFQNSQRDMQETNQVVHSVNINIKSNRSVNFIETNRSNKLAKSYSPMKWKNKSQKEIDEKEEIRGNKYVDISKLITPSKLLKMSNDDIILHGELFKLSTEVNKSYDVRCYAYTTKFLVLTKSEFKYYSSKTDFLKMLKPKLIIPLKDVLEVNYLSENFIKSMPVKKLSIKENGKLNGQIYHMYLRVHGSISDKDNTLFFNQTNPKFTTTIHPTEHLFNESNLGTNLGKSEINNQTHADHDQTTSQLQLFNKDLKKSSDNFNHKIYSSRSQFSEEKLKNILIFASSNLNTVNIWLSVNEFMMKNIQ